LNTLIKIYSKLIIKTEIEKKQIARLNQLRLKRDKNKVDHAIELLVKNAEKDNQNLMPHIINAVKNRVTLGEISDAFQSVFGKYEPRISF
jgi:methylmalonyl-CoA mutase N-terminal domain/subunit